MAKGKTSIYFCQNCGFESSKWMGQCPGCKEWNTFVEEVVDRKAAASSSVKKALEEAKPVPLSAVSSADEKRTSTDMKELDRVLGGGIVRGGLMLIGGDPGIGICGCGRYHRHGARAEKSCCRFSHLYVGLYGRMHCHGDQSVYFSGLWYRGSCSNGCAGCQRNWLSWRRYNHCDCPQPD